MGEQYPPTAADYANSRASDNSDKLAKATERIEALEQDVELLKNRLKSIAIKVHFGQ